MLCLLFENVSSIRLYSRFISILYATALKCFVFNILAKQTRKLVPVNETKYVKHCLQVSEFLNFPGKSVMAVPRTYVSVITSGTLAGKRQVRGTASSVSIS